MGLDWALLLPRETQERSPSPKPAGPSAGGPFSRENEKPWAAGHWWGLDCHRVSCSPMQRPLTGVWVGGEREAPSQEANQRRGALSKPASQDLGPLCPQEAGKCLFSSAPRACAVRKGILPTSSKSATSSQFSRTREWKDCPGWGKRKFQSQVSLDHELGVTPLDLIAVVYSIRVHLLSSRDPVPCAVLSRMRRVPTVSYLTL